MQRNYQLKEVAIPEQPPYPLHESVKDRLSPDYVEFYNHYLLNATPVHHLPVGVARKNSGIPPSHSKPLPGNEIQDISISRKETPGPNLQIRCFTPSGIVPKSGWPLVHYFHGGGWVFGDLDTENTVCTNICVRSHAVVVTTDYRLAPEAPWPAAVHDCWEAFLWSIWQGPARLKLDLKKVAISGSSAGANLAAVIVQKAALRQLHGIRLRLQVLVVPPMDNTALPHSNSSWRTYEFTAHLPAEKMLWFRNHYLPNEVDRSHPEASPLRASNEVLRLLPPSYIVVGELDILRHDGEEYARLLKLNGVSAEVTVMKGMPHPFLAMDGVLKAGKTTITNICARLFTAFDA